MTRTGPQRYPGASTAYWWQGTWGGDAMESNVVVWHTTEGTSLPSYRNGADAPNFTAKPDFARKRLVWYQHFDFDTSSRALVNLAGGVETNTLNVVQVEIVGTCDPATHKRWGSVPHLYTPDLPDWAVRDLAAFAKWAHDEHGVPLSSGVTFKAYPGSYGTSNGVRMSYAKWNGYRGHCGHQHVPENLHGDPGAFPMAAVLARAAGQISKEDSMPTPADVWNADVIAAAPPPYNNADWEKGNHQWTARYALSTAVLAGRRTEAKVDALEAQAKSNGAMLTQLGQKVDALTVGGVDLDVLAAKVAAAPGLAEAIAEQVAEKLAARLAE